MITKKMVMLLVLGSFLFASLVSGSITNDEESVPDKKVVLPQDESSLLNGWVSPDILRDELHDSIVGNHCGFDNPEGVVVAWTQAFVNNDFESFVRCNLVFQLPAFLSNREETKKFFEDSTTQSSFISLRFSDIRRTQEFVNGFVQVPIKNKDGAGYQVTHFPAHVVILKAIAVVESKSKVGPDFKTETYIGTLFYLTSQLKEEMGLTHSQVGEWVIVTLVPGQ